MPSDRRTIHFRPDAEEESLLTQLTRLRGLSMSRVLGQALREMAKREGLTATAAPQPQSAQADAREAA